MYGLAMAKGLLVTLKNLTKKPFTVQYPEERLKQHPRFRGEEFVWYEERCTGCASCAKYCPLGIIKIVTSPQRDRSSRGRQVPAGGVRHRHQPLHVLRAVCRGVPL